ncbi:hypothetical protein HMPREF1980_02374 [Actinomyces sp. oral taxon 172 str. F0311]|nr:hypothetical protein HMPREF1980_02374 [Actinomyces sp. oral taxon 172 str. F0311]
MTFGSSPAGGENYWPTGGQDHATGSSPRGRGKRVDGVDDEIHRRLIPARAGKTHPPRRRPALSPAHPRVGGENDAERQIMNLQDGSSPRRRGKRF